MWTNFSNSFTFGFVDKLPQGIAATEFRCGGWFYFTVFHSLSTNPKVKELLKSVHICQSYR